MKKNITKSAADYALEQIEGLEEQDEFERIPHDSESLIELLDIRFPERLPATGEADRDYLIYLGQRDMANYLKRWAKDSKEQACAAETL